MIRNQHIDQYLIGLDGGNIDKAASPDCSSSESFEHHLSSFVDPFGKAGSLSTVIDHYLSTVPLARSISLFATESIQLEQSIIVDSEKASIIIEKIHYNKTLRLLGLFTLFAISVAFAPSVFRFVEQGIWLSNPIVGTIKHPEQNVLTSHAVSAMIWSIICTIQVIFGSFMMNHGQNWIGRKAHIIIGRYIWPILMLVFLISALWILFHESSENRIHISIIILNVVSCVMIVLWAALGYYFVYTKQYERHKDCMICVFVSAFVPGLLRMVRYVFQLMYYIKYKQHCIDVNPFPYLMFMSVLFLLIIVISLRKRLKKSEPHNLLFAFGILLPIVFPMMTMKIDFDPCNYVNVPSSNLDIIIG